MKWIVLYRTLFENALFKMFNHYMYVLLIVMLIIIDDAIARVTYMKRSMCLCVWFALSSLFKSAVLLLQLMLLLCGISCSVFFRVHVHVHAFCVFELKSIRYVLFVSVSM